MATATWTGPSGGDFNTGSFWSTGSVPAAGTIAIINGTSASGLTVDLSSGTVEPEQLIATLSTLDIVDGTMTLLQASTLDALEINGNGTLAFENGGSSIASQSTIAGPISRMVGTIEVDAGSVILGGTSSLGGRLAGTGTVITNDVATLDGLNVSNGTTLLNTGTALVDAASLELGSAGTVPAIFINAAGGTFDFTTDFGGITSQFGIPASAINEGLIEKLSGTGFANIEASFTNANTGVVKVDSGVIDFGAENTYGGTLTGAGGVAFYSAHQTIASGAVLTIGTIDLVGSGGGGGTLDFQGNASFGGTLLAVFGVISPDGHVFELLNTATADLTYGSVVNGTLLIDGTQSLDAFNIEGGGTLENRGTVSITTSPLALFFSGTEAPPVLINEAGATFEINGDTNIDGYTGSWMDNAGLLIKTVGSPSGESADDVFLVNTGTIDVAAGMLRLSGGGNFGGTIEGAGTIAFVSGVTPQVLNAGLSLIASNVSIFSSVTLAGDVTYGGTLTAAGATVYLNSHTLTLAGSAPGYNYALQLAGPGELAITGTRAVDGVYIGDQVTVDNRGTISISDYSLYLGNTNSAAATLMNESGALIQLADGTAGLTGILKYLDAPSIILNAGTLDKSGTDALAYVTPTFVNTGTAQSDSGILDFSASNAYSGTLAGAGTIEMMGVTQTLAAGLVLSVATLWVPNGVTLAADQSYGGDLLAEAAVIALDGHTLTLTNSATASLYGAEMVGGGVLQTEGTQSVSGLTIGDGVTLHNTGLDLIDINGPLNLGLSGAPAAFLLNDGIFDLTTDSGINLLGTQETIVSTDLFEKTGGTLTSVIQPTFSSTGVVEADSGIILLRNAAALSGLVAGVGTVVTDGTTSVDGLYVESGATLQNVGTETLNALPLTLGDEPVLAKAFKADAFIESARATAINTNVFDITGDTSINSANNIQSGFVALDAVDSTQNIFINQGFFERTSGSGLATVNPLFDNTGSVVVSTGTLQFETVTNDGRFEVNSPSELDVSGSVGADTSSSGNFSVGDDGVFQFDDSVASSQTVTFTDDTGFMALTSPLSFDGIITDFQGTAAQSDAIGLIGTTGLTYNYFGNSSSGTLVFDGSGNAPVANLFFEGKYNKNSFIVQESKGSTIVTLCFRRGTLIQTPDREVPVEDLQPGDHVVTASGEAKPIKWIGRRRIDCTRHPEPAAAWPVLIKAGAFGPELPRRDLYVSPRHAIFAEGVLVPAKILINGLNVVQAEVDFVDYFHIELQLHDILLAEGLPSETYLETGNRHIFENGGGVICLHPDMSRWVWDARACAELKIVGAEVEAIKATLLRQAKRAKAKRARVQRTASAAPRRRRVAS